MKVNLIVARSKNGVIGIGPNIPWKIPGDFKNFRAMTETHVVIMGRKTLESLPGPLPNRLNIVITRRPCDIKVPRVVAVQTLTEALELAKSMNAREAWICGGERLYEEAFPIVDEMHITEVDMEIPYKLGDDIAKFIIDIDRDRWVQTKNKYYASDINHPGYMLNIWKRRCRPHLYANDILLYEPEKFCKVEESEDEFVYPV